MCLHKYWNAFASNCIVHTLGVRSEEKIGRRTDLRVTVQFEAFESSRNWSTYVEIY